MRHGLAGLADMHRASLHILTDAVAALSRARIMATGVQRAQPVEPWHKLMFARVVDKRGTAAEDPVQAPPGPRWLCCCSPRGSLGEYHKVTVDVTALKLELRAFLEANAGAVWVY